MPQDVLDRIAPEERRFANAPRAFFEAWKRSVDIAGGEGFGDGTREGLQRAITRRRWWYEAPNQLRQQHRKKQMPKWLVEALHLAGAADVRVLIFEADAQVLDGLPLHDDE
ncbi:hypothetical protein [Cupriavidus sp. DF5525]|uniref:DUF5983 family protein n=1 Tax=Cupriavidus sp. DF5525 TaxID=3160989 RepID=UPI0035A9257B